MSELKPCPFCDEQNTVVRLKQDGKPTGKVGHACFVLGIEIRTSEKQWNTRAERTCVLEDIPYEPGRWEGVRCSSCGVTDEDTDLTGNYCPHCGAKVVES
jgi:hypothetical protein